MGEKQSREDLHESIEVGHERRYANLPVIVVYGLGMLVLVIMMSVVLSVVVYREMVWFSHGEPGTTEFQAPQSYLPPQPRIEENPWLDLRQYRDAETRQLETYSWLDRAKGEVRIPVARAMEMLAARPPVSLPPVSTSGIEVRPAEIAPAGTARGILRRGELQGDQPATPSREPGKRKE